MSTKDIAFAALAFATPFVLWFGWVVLMVPKTGGMRGGGEIGTAIMAVVMFGGPLLGFGFIARSFRRWRNLDRPSKILIVGMSCAYWLLYIPALYLVWALYVLGRAGGI